jgi:hypothetical protein
VTTVSEQKSVATVDFQTPDGRPVIIFAHQIVAVTQMPTMKATAIVGPSSTAIPVTDSIQDAITKIKAAMLPTTQTEVQADGT